LYVEDFADAAEFVLKNYDGDHHLNIGVGEGVSIADFARLVAQAVEAMRARSFLTLASPTGRSGNPSRCRASQRSVGGRELRHARGCRWRIGIF